jgi:uncharacterized membrane protein
MTPERTVLLVGLLGGLLCAALTPPFQAPDETRHFLRIYQISEGVLFPRAGRAELPESVIRVEAGFLEFQFQPEKKIDLRTWREAAAVRLAPERRIETGIGGAALSTPAPYLPQALAALAGRELELPPLAILYLCRLANLSAALAVAWAAVRIAPFYRWLFAFLALDPMALFLRSSTSPDALTNAMALLLVASVLALAVGPPERERGRIALLLGSATFLVLAKGASYLLLPALVLLIPAEYWRDWGDRRRAAATIGLLIVLTGAGAGLSGWAARRGFSQLRPEVAADPAAQMAQIALRPGRFLAIVITDAVRHAPVYAIQFVGNLGWLDTPLPAAVLLGYALLLTALALLDGASDFTLGGGRRLLVAAITAGTLLAVFASQYLLWTAVGADIVEGVQGRYFLPLAPAAALLFLNRRWARDLDRAGRWLFGAAVFTTAVTLVKVGLRYYRF